MSNDLLLKPAQEPRNPPSYSPWLRRLHARHQRHDADPYDRDSERSVSRMVVFAEDSRKQRDRSDGRAPVEDTRRVPAETRYPLSTAQLVAIVDTQLARLEKRLAGRLSLAGDVLLSGGRKNSTLKQRSL